METLGTEALEEVTAAEKAEVENPRIRAFGSATPVPRLTQEETFRMLGYSSQRILQIFLNSGIDFRHFYLDPADFNRSETPDELNQRYLQGALDTGCRAVNACLESAGMTPRKVDLLLVCTCTGYVCPDLGSRLIQHMGFRRNVERGSPAGVRLRGAQFPPFSAPATSCASNPAAWL
jgi:predicted naringenin-chalcone synthase